MSLVTARRLAKGVPVMLLVSAPGPTTSAPPVMVGGVDVGSRQVPTIERVDLSADSIGIGDRFELRLTLIVGDDRVAFLPDSLEGPGFEQLGPVEWSGAPRPGGDTELSIVYPLIAFDVGAVTVPDFEVFTGLRAESEATGLSTGGAVVGSWSAFREAPAALLSARIAFVPARSVSVASVLVPDETTGGLVPRPAADVWGGDRHWLSTILMAAFGLGLVTLLATALRGWRSKAVVRRGVGAPVIDPRGRALLALDELLGTGLHLDGHVKEFFTESSTIVRDYVEAFDERWTRAWTSTELMKDLASRASDVPRADATTMDGERSDVISSEMARAEGVKFGGVRPDATEAETHWRVVRDWIETSSSPRRGAPGPGGKQ